MKRYQNIVLIPFILILLSCHRRDKVAIIILGDSFANGIGSEGTTKSADYYAGKQKQGEYTWGKQLQRLLEKRKDYTYEVFMYGFPGQTAAWYIHSNELQLALKNLESDGHKYKHIIYCSAFGTNDEAAVNVNDSTSVDTLINNISKVSKLIRSVKNIKGKLTIIGFPLTRVEGKYAKPNGNAFRNRYNKLIANDPSLIGADKILDYKKYPSLYSDDAPEGSSFNQHDVDGLNSVHPNNKGYSQLAKMTEGCIIDIVKK